MEEKKQYSALTIDRAAFLLLRVKKAFKKKKQQRKERERSKCEKSGNNRTGTEESILANRLDVSESKFKSTKTESENTADISKSSHDLQNKNRHKSKLNEIRRKVETYCRIMTEFENNKNLQDIYDLKGKIENIRKQLNEINSNLEDIKARKNEIESRVAFLLGRVDNIPLKIRVKGFIMQMNDFNWQDSSLKKPEDFLEYGNFLFSQCKEENELSKILQKIIIHKSFLEFLLNTKIKLTQNDDIIEYGATVNKLKEILQYINDKQITCNSKFGKLLQDYTYLFFKGCLNKLIIQFNKHNYQADADILKEISTIESDFNIFRTILENSHQKDINNKIKKININLHKVMYENIGDETNKFKSEKDRNVDLNLIFPIMKINEVINFSTVYSMESSALKIQNQNKNLFLQQMINSAKINNDEMDIPGLNVNNLKITLDEEKGVLNSDKQTNLHVFEDNLIEEHEVNGPKNIYSKNHFEKDLIQIISESRQEKSNEENSRENNIPKTKLEQQKTNLTNFDIANNELRINNIQYNLSSIYNEETLNEVKEEQTNMNPPIDLNNLNEKLAASGQKNGSNSIKMKNYCTNENFHESSKSDSFVGVQNISEPTLDENYDESSKVDESMIITNLLELKTNLNIFNIDSTLQQMEQYNNKRLPTICCDLYKELIDIIEELKNLNSIKENIDFIQSEVTNLPIASYEICSRYIDRLNEITPKIAKIRSNVAIITSWKEDCNNLQKKCLSDLNKSLEEYNYLANIDMDVTNILDKLENHEQVNFDDYTTSLENLNKCLKDAEGCNVSSDTSETTKNKIISNITRSKNYISKIMTVLNQINLNESALNKNIELFKTVEIETLTDNFCKDIEQYLKDLIITENCHNNKKVRKLVFEFNKQVEGAIKELKNFKESVDKLQIMNKTLNKLSSDISCATNSSKYYKFTLECRRLSMENVTFKNVTIDKEIKKIKENIKNCKDVIETQQSTWKMLESINEDVLQIKRIKSYEAILERIINWLHQLSRISFSGNNQNISNFKNYLQQKLCRHSLRNELKIVSSEDCNIETCEDIIKKLHLFLIKLNEIKISNVDNNQNMVKRFIIDNIQKFEGIERSLKEIELEGHKIKKLQTKLETSRVIKLEDFDFFYSELNSIVNRINNIIPFREINKKINALLEATKKYGTNLQTKKLQNIENEIQNSIANIQNSTSIDDMNMFKYFYGNYESITNHLRTIQSNGDEKNRQKCIQANRNYIQLINEAFKCYLQKISLKIQDFHFNISEEVYEEQMSILEDILTFITNNKNTSEANFEKYIQDCMKYLKNVYEEIEINATKLHGIKNEFESISTNFNSPIRNYEEYAHKQQNMEYLLNKLSEVKPLNDLLCKSSQQVEEILKKYLVDLNSEYKDLLMDEINSIKLQSEKILTEIFLKKSIIADKIYQTYKEDLNKLLKALKKICIVNFDLENEIKICENILKESLLFIDNHKFSGLIKKNNFEVYKIRFKITYDATDEEEFLEYEKKLHKLYTTLDVNYRIYCEENIRNCFDKLSSVKSGFAYNSEDIIKQKNQLTEALLELDKYYTNLIQNQYENNYNNNYLNEKIIWISNYLKSVLSVDKVTEEKHKSLLEKVETYVQDVIEEGGIFVKSFAECESKLFILHLLKPDELKETEIVDLILKIDEIMVKPSNQLFEKKIEFIKRAHRIWESIKK